MYVVERQTVDALTRVLFWCLYPKLWSNEGNNTWVDESEHLWLVGDRKRMFNTTMLIYRHDMSSGLQYLNDNSYWDTMTGTNSLIDRLILRQNVEINSNEYFSYNIFFFWNEIIDHVDRIRHCAITKKNVFDFRVISMIYYCLSDNHRCNFSFIHHLLFAIFLVRCVIVPGCQLISMHRSSDFKTTSALHVD